MNKLTEESIKQQIKEARQALRELTKVRALCDTVETLLRALKLAAQAYIDDRDESCGKVLPESWGNAFCSRRCEEAVRGAIPVWHEEDAEMIWGEA